MNVDVAVLRNRRFSLWALLIVLPIALWVAIGDNWLEFRKRNREDIVIAPPGAPYDFEGAAWQLEALEIMPADRAGTLPPNTMRVLVRVAFTPKDAAAVERVSQCEVVLRSEGGKRWTPGGFGFVRSADRLPISCRGSYQVRPEAGKLFRFEKSFVVPTYAVDDVQALIMLPIRKPNTPRPPQLLLSRR